MSKILPSDENTEMTHNQTTDPGLTHFFWLKMLASVARKLLFGVGVALATRGYITDDQAATMSSFKVAEYLTTFVFLAVPFIWQYAVINWNVHFPKIAHAAPPNTPVAEVKAEVYKKRKFVSQF